MHVQDFNSASSLLSKLLTVEKLKLFLTQISRNIFFPLFFLYIYNIYVYFELGYYYEFKFPWCLDQYVHFSLCFCIFSYINDTYKLHERHVHARAHTHTICIMHDASLEVVHVIKCHNHEY